MENLEIKTIEIKKGEKVEYWKAIQIDEKTFRISNYIADKIIHNYKPYIELYCLYIPHKNLLLSKEEKDRILIAKSDTEIYPKNYKVIAKDDKNMIVLLNSEYDYLLTVGEKRRVVPLPRSGRRLGEDIDLRLVELYDVDEELFKKGFRITLIPADYEIYPKNNTVHIIAKTEAIDEAYIYDPNSHRLMLVPKKKEILIAYREREYLFLRKGNKGVLIHSSLYYSDDYKIIEFDEDIEIDNETFYEMLIREHNHCYITINNAILYSDPKRLNFYEHSLLNITLVEKAKIVAADVTYYKHKEKKKLLTPGNGRILFIHNTHSLKEENVFYTIHSEKIPIHKDDPELVTGYTGKKTIDITDLSEEDEIVIKKWKYEIVDYKEEGENIYTISVVEETKARVLGVIEERRIKLSDFLKELKPYEIKRECEIKEENITEGIRTHEKHEIAIPAF
ncbi:MAG: hypothetical protein JHC31_03990 [Sulfurihydrogenibium sp.]|nr:hypothetical protein [Sulfurihydrogenibium sp.]